MHDWIPILAWTVAALSLAAVGNICRCCRRMRREKDRRIVQAVRRQDRLAHELERVRIQKETLLEVLGEESPCDAGTSAETGKRKE